MARKVYFYYPTIRPRNQTNGIKAIDPIKRPVTSDQRSSSFLVFRGSPERFSTGESPTYHPIPIPTQFLSPNSKRTSLHFPFSSLPSSISTFQSPLSNLHHTIHRLLCATSSVSDFSHPIIGLSDYAVSLSSGYPSSKYDPLEL